MRQGFIRGFALCALTVVALAPVASAGAAGGGSGSASGATGTARSTPEAPARPLRWSDVFARLREKQVIGRDTDAGTPIASAATLTPAAAPAAVPATPTLTVTPSTGLVGGDQVTVAGTGFPAHQFVLVECTAGGTTPDQCGLGLVQSVRPDASGAFSASTNVSRTLRLYPGSHVDCAAAAGTCEVAAIDVNSTTEIVSVAAPLTFDPNAPLPHPSIVVTPATGLLDAQQVSVAGTGFAPGSFVSVTQCIVGGFSCSGSEAHPVGADGTFTVSVQLSLRVNDNFGGLTTCLAVACNMDAESYDSPDYYALAPLAFDPTQPVPAPPAITVTPHTGLHHDQQVQVHGSGFFPGSEIELTQCPPSSFGSCSDFFDYVNADATGVFDATVAVTRLVTSYGPLDQTTTLDCATAACTISVSSFDQQLSLVASAALAFDGSVPPPALPVVTVTPDSDLPFRATVAVHGSGYGPGDRISADMCLDDQSSGVCGIGFGSANATADGTFDLTLPVQRRISFGPGEGIPTIDCASPTATCSIDVQAEHGYQHVSVPITFDPNAPIPPPPSASISPDHDLGYRQGVTVTGANFPPGPVQVEQCAPPDPSQPFSVCDGYSQLTADEAGNVRGTVTVTRVLAFGSSSIDCLTVACVLQLGDFGPDDSATVALQFDPSAQPPPPPSLTVTPSTGLFDGRHVTVGGANFTPGSIVGVTECTAGTAAIADGCDLGQVRIATVGADGTFSRRYVTESVLGTADGPIDCSTAPNRCVLAAANAPIGQDYASAALGFDPPELTVQGIGVTEGTGGMNMAPVRVMLSKPDRSPITVHWMAEPGTATSGTDFTSMRGTLTIPAGATEAMIDASVVADAIDEPTETFTIRVVDALGTRVTDRVGTVTIHDDDAAPPSVTVHDTSRREDHGEAQAEVTLSAPSGKTVIVHYVTHHLTARAGSDYVRKDSRLVFRPGETRHLVRVVLVDDAVHEATETFSVVLDEVEQATIARGTATLTVTDDD